MVILIVEDVIKDSSFCATTIQEIVPKAIIKEFTNAEDALLFLDNNLIDAMFIDRQLPGMNGYELADKVRTMQVYHLLPIIFVTGLQDDATIVRNRFKNYEYINKPYTKDEFKEQTENFLLSIYAQSLRHNENKKIIIMKKLFADEEDIFVNVHDIVYAEVSGKFIKIFTKDEPPKTIKMTMDYFIEYVDDPLIVRSHRSYAANVRYIKKIKNRMVLYGKTKDEKSKHSWTIYFTINNYQCQLSLQYRSDIINFSRALTER